MHLHALFFSWVSQVPACFTLFFSWGEALRLEEQRIRLEETAIREEALQAESERIGQVRAADARARSFCFVGVKSCRSDGG
jgi:hypothetical protein